MNGVNYGAPQLRTVTPTFPLQVCKLLRHIATTDSLQVAAKYGEINLRIYGPQVVTAAQTLCLYPTSKIAKENVEGEGTDEWDVCG